MDLKMVKLLTSFPNFFSEPPGKASVFHFSSTKWSKPTCFVLKSCGSNGLLMEEINHIPKHAKVAL